MKILNKIKNSAGFTLVEIIVAITILAAATTGVGSIIVSTTNTANKELNGNTLQQNCSDIQEDLHNKILATTTAINYRAKEGKLGELDLSLKNVVDATEETLSLMSYDYNNHIFKKEFIKYVKEDNALYYSMREEKITINAGDSADRIITFDDKADIMSITDWTLMSNNVTGFDVSLSSSESNKMVSFSIELTRDGVSYSASDNVSLRNTVNINKTEFSVNITHITTLKIPVLSAYLFNYDGIEHTVTDSGFLERYMKRTVAQWSATNAGTYKVSYSLLDPATTQWADGTVEDKTLTWTIKQKVVSLAWTVEPFTWEYDRKEHKVTSCAVTNLCGSDVCTVSLINNSITKVGSVICRANALSNPNYILPDDAAVTERKLEVTIGTPKVTAPVAKTGLVYNTAAQALITAAVVDGGTPEYRVKFGTGSYGSWGSAVPTGTNAGTYYVQYRVIGEEGYKSLNESGGDVIAIGTLTIAIDKAPGKVTTAPTAKTLTYNEAAQELVNAANGTGSIYYSTSSATSGFSTALPKGTNAGSYTVWYYAASNDNYYQSSTGSVSCTINKRPITVTLSPTSYTYTGSAITVSPTLSVNLSHTYSGNQYTNVGDYTVTTTLASSLTANNYISSGASISWSITRARTASASGVNRTYNGSSQTGVSGSYVNWSGTTSATNASTYTAYATPDSNHAWSDGSYGQKTISWTMSKRGISVSIGTSTFTYNGSTQTVTLSTSPSVSFSYGGTRSAVNAGSYTVSLTLSDTTNNYISNSASFSWKINRATGAAASATNRTYNGSSQSGVASYSYVSLSGTTSATNAGGYSFSATPDGNHTWSDGSTGAKSFSWTMNRARSASASAANKSYNGSSQTGVSGSNVTWSGTTTGTNAGGYTAYATPTSNYAWSDGGTGQKTISWSISRITGAYVTVASGSTYNGATKYGYSDYGYVSLSGTTSSTNAGSFSYTATPDGNHTWSDGSTGAKSFSWSIGKAGAYAGGTYTHLNGTDVSFALNAGGSKSMSHYFNGLCSVRFTSASSSSITAYACYSDGSTTTFLTVSNPTINISNSIILNNLPATTTGCYVRYYIASSTNYNAGNIYFYITSTRRNATASSSAISIENTVNSTSSLTITGGIPTLTNYTTYFSLSYTQVSGKIYTYTTTIKRLKVYSASLTVTITSKRTDYYEAGSFSVIVRSIN